MPKLLTQAEALSKSRETHLDRYTYDHFRYESSSKKVLITCPIHGDFACLPQHHWRGVGCRECYFESNKRSLASFLTEAKAHFGDKYDYSLVCEPFDQQMSVDIICKAHNLTFSQVARNHSRGHTGCPACLALSLSGPSIERGSYSDEESLNYRMTKLMSKVHNNQYDYSSTQYKGAREKISYHCPKHGRILQNAVDHLKGTGCPKCSIDKKHSNSFKATTGLTRAAYHRAIKRLASGMSMKEALLPDYLRSDRRVQLITVFGKTYPNLRAAIRELNPPASEQTIARWIKQGLSPDEALSTTPSTHGKTGIIYLVTHVSGKQYVGLTVQPLQLRWQHHLEHAGTRNGIKSEQSLHALIRKSDPAAFKVEIIDTGIMGKDLEQKERHWISTLQTLAPSGLNISPGGTSGGSRPHPVEIDGIKFRSKKEAAQYVAITRNISLHAAKYRIWTGRIDL